MHLLTRSSIGTFLIVGCLSCIGEWNQFRGPNGNGMTDAKLPMEWSEEKNVEWKTAIHGRAWSSPVISGDQIWLTTASLDGKKLSAICVDAISGEIVLDRQLFEVDEPQFAHKFNSYASPSPVLEDGRAYLTFGSPGTACLDTTNFEVLWSRTDIECNHFRGAGSSPIIFGDLLIMNFDGSDQHFVTAWDKQSGETVWRVERSIDFKDLDVNGKPKLDGDLRKAFSTPHVGVLGGQSTLVSIGAMACYGYEPLTGRELWRFEERTSHSGSTRPLIVGDWLFYPTGFSKGVMMAHKVAKGGVVNEETLAWSIKRGVPQKPSPLMFQGLVFLVGDGGVMTCLNATSGEEVWSERVGGNYSASPILANGKIYCCNQEGKTVVVAAKDEFEVLAENVLDDGFMASPAVHQDSLILRTESHLYKISH